MEIAGDQCLGRQTSGHDDDLDVQALVAVIPQLLGDKMRIVDHAKAGKRHPEIFQVRRLG